MIALWILVGVVLAAFGLVVLRGAPYVPTHRKQLESAFDELLPLTERDTVVDLGSGDGVVLLAAAKRGAGTVGYELNPFLVLISWLRLRRFKRSRIIMQDFMLLPSLPPETTVVYAFTTGHTIDAIGRKMVEWSEMRELHFISYGFTLGDREPVRSRGPMHLYAFKQ